MPQKSEAPTTEISEPDKTTLPGFLTSFSAMLPNDLILIRVKDKSTYASYQLTVNGVGLSRGILCFSTHAIASKITKLLFPEYDFVMEDHTLDSAHSIAKAKSPPINCLLLFDNPKNPIVHYVS